MTSWRGAVVTHRHAGEGLFSWVLAILPSLPGFDREELCGTEVVDVGEVYATWSNAAVCDIEDGVGFAEDAALVAAGCPRGMSNVPKRAGSGIARVLGGVGLVVDDECLAESLEGSGEDMGAGLAGEVEVEVEVVDGYQPQAEDFFCFHKVSQVGACEVLAGMA